MCQTTAMGMEPRAVSRVLLRRQQGRIIDNITSSSIRSIMSVVSINDMMMVMVMVMVMMMMMVVMMMIIISNSSSGGGGGGGGSGSSKVLLRRQQGRGRGECYMTSYYII